LFNRKTYQLYIVDDVDYSDAGRSIIKDPQGKYYKLDLSSVNANQLLINLELE